MRTYADIMDRGHRILNRPMLVPPMKDCPDMKLICGRRAGNSNEAFLKYLAYQSSWFKHMDETNAALRTQWPGVFDDTPETERAQ